ncbi:hypothetical protein Tco_0893538 [Tanacetum coccineum]|uniref:F-box associated beta-propeller type 1 domain-containing protein n=1 Tax=Tanacetum coccineum TaxID=301880 RepID=A0ABQ5C930_9ASTR
MDHSFGFAEEVDHVRILQSCNGLLLCSGSAWPIFYYVYNPSTNLFKRLPQPNYYLGDDSCFFSSGVFRLAFDPIQSSHYKVVQARGEAGKTWIQIYSLEIGNWSFCRDRFSYFSFDHFESEIYWNDAFYWLEGLNRELKHCKLNIEDHDHPIMTSLEIAHGLHRGRNFLESFGGPIYDPILLLMEIPHMLHLEGKFFESCGCLLLVCRDDIGSTEITIYEMMKGSFVWSVRYLDAFVVINLSGKVVKFNLISKTNIEIFDIGSNQMDDDEDDDDDAVLFIPPFEVDPNLYEFIPSLASV